MSLVQDLIAGRPPQDERWEVDGPSKCLIPLGAASPFRYSSRTTAPVDRISQISARGYESACVEFHASAGLWTVIVFAGEEAKAEWLGPVQAALRLMADTGVGGERSRGWGRFQKPEFHEAPFPAILLGRREEKADEDPAETAYWLLSMYAPAATDSIDWSRGAYQPEVRSGRVESNPGWGTEYRSVRMIAEGSVLLAGSALAGTAVDVAPAGFAHPVYRAGYAVAVPVPWRASTLSQSLPPLRAPEPEPAPEPVPEPAPEPAPEPVPEPESEPAPQAAPEEESQ